ncbi:hypothetical protein ACERII_07965 [Evansella sp. AB-rgal1]|uniref:hypothetical protein n=1 Tax=Evansella sp. AB-rgal1 TaxID=3242696 RepID=UPI00359E1B57
MQKKLGEMSYEEIQQSLVEYTMNTIESKTITPLIYFPIVHERVEIFLIAYWRDIFEQCKSMTWREWLKSECFELYKNEVRVDVLEEVEKIESSENRLMT